MEIVMEKTEILKLRIGPLESGIAGVSGAVRAFTGGTRVPLSEKNAGAGTRPPTRRSAEAPLAAADQGGAEWERALIAASRERGFLWRTEETYRMGVAQSARFLVPRPPDAAGAGRAESAGCGVPGGSATGPAADRAGTGERPNSKPRDGGVAYPMEQFSGAADVSGLPHARLGNAARRCRGAR